MQQAAGTTKDQQVLTRIGFAERWLDRAKRQCAEGNVTRGLLTLVLADAEVHHALEVGGASAARSQNRAATSAVLAMAVVAAAATLVASRVSPPPAALSAETAPLVLTLGLKVGTLLELVQSPPTPARQPGVAEAPMVRRAATRSTPDGGVRTAPLESARNSRLPRAPVPATAASPQAVAVSASTGSAAPAISDGDLIDLVIAAERTLRKPAGP